MTYEMLLLIGVLALGFLLPHLLLGLIWKISTPGWLTLAHAFLLLGVYFVWYWTHQGQTLAMQTWKIRLESAQGGLVSRKQAILRYCLSCLWLLPAVMSDYFLHTHGSGHLLTLFLFGIFFWPLTALATPDRQFPHDLLAGTRLVNAISST